MMNKLIMMKDGLNNKEMETKKLPNLPKLLTPTEMLLKMLPLTENGLKVKLKIPTTI